MALDNLIYDRTEGDTERWLYLSRKLDTEGWAELTAAEKREWLTQLKGAYNYTDINRVGSAVEYLGERFTSLITHLIEYRALYGVADDPLFRVPYTAADVDIDPKTDWTIGDNVWAERAVRYLVDLTVVRGLLPLAADAPSVPADMVDLMALQREIQGTSGRGGLSHAASLRRTDQGCLCWSLQLLHQKQSRDH